MPSPPAPPPCPPRRRPRRARLPPSALLLALVAPVFAAACAPCAALSFPTPSSALARLPAKASIVENTCKCDCCYRVGAMQRTECVPDQYTTFDVHTCSACTVAACAAAFPISCEQPTSVVNSDCIVRRGWMLRLVPILFIAISVALLVYGCFIKKYDGYHPVTEAAESLMRTRSRLAGYLPTDFGAAAAAQHQPQAHTRSNSWGAANARRVALADAGPSTSRGAPTLPPISELQEVESQPGDQLSVRAAQYGAIDEEEGEAKAEQPGAGA